MELAKEEVYLGGAIRLLAQNLIAVKPFNLAEADKEKILVPAEYDKINDKLANFRLICLYFLIIQKNRINSRRTPEEIGATIMQAIELAYLDNGYSEEQTNVLLEQLMDSVENYNNHIKSEAGEEVKGGIHQLLCDSFADEVMPVTNAEDAVQKDKRWFAYITAMQTFSTVMAGIDKVFQTYNVVDM
ncbi:MAG: hypothetical protein GX949_08660 [Peptococcaceae bacterium]|jgi:hypothetical protein|nr:hypothetical protein [Peptococcaceae bacterium]